MTNVAPLTVRLRASDRPAIARHFLALEGEDRRLRFGAPIGDEAVRGYVARLDFEQDGLFAVRSHSARILGAIHVALVEDTAELGLSVLRGLRGRGIGAALFARAVAHLRNRGVGEVFVHCLSENAAMMHLARKSGMAITRDGEQSAATLRLAPPDPGSLFHEWLHEQQAASLHGLRAHLRSVRGMWRMRRLARAACPRRFGRWKPGSTGASW